MRFQTIGWRDLEHLINKPNIRLIDLRTKEEFEDYHLEGANNIPYEDLKRHKNNFSKSLIYVLYCERGAASLMAARELSREGYRVYTVIGGIHAWEELYGSSEK